MASHMREFLDDTLDIIREHVFPLAAFWEPEDYADIYKVAAGNRFTFLSGSVLACWKGGPSDLAAALLREAAKAPDRGGEIETIVQTRWHVLHELNLAFNVGRLIRPRMQRHWAFASAREEGCFALNLGQMAILTDWYLAEFTKVLKTCEIVAAPRFPEPLPMRGVTFQDQSDEVVSRFQLLGANMGPVQVARTEPREGASPTIDRAAAEKEWLKFGLPYPMPDYFWKRPKELAAPAKEPEKGGGG